MLLSIVPIVISKEINSEEFEKSQSSISKRILNILIAFIVVGLFWGIYEISNIRIFDLQMQFSEISAWNISKILWQTIGSIFTLPITLVAIVLWTFFYSSQFFKLMVGFIFGAISLGILFLIPEIPTENHTITYLISLVFLGISEIHIAPIVHSILTKYSNPKYLAILISLAFLPTRLISLIFGLFNDKLYDNPMLGLKIGIVGMTVIGIGLIGYVVWNKNYLQHRV
jgi:POT family proton-dependent oligopeptide transporter